MQVEIILKPCPWCYNTPDIYMPIPEDETWCWKILCINPLCKMHPESPHVSIRNTSKTDFLMFRNKLESLVDRWNGGNLLRAKDKKIIQLEKIASQFKTNYFNVMTHIWSPGGEG